MSNISLSSVKKLFCIKKNKKKSDESVVEPERVLQVKNLEVFRPIPNQVVERFEDVKVTLTELLNSGQLKMTDHQLFDKKLNSLVEYLQKHVILQEYIYCVYSKDQKLEYNLMVEELSLTCEELSNQLKNMLFFNNRNLRVAEMMAEITQSSKQLEEKKKQICMEVEFALKQRMTHKWSILKTSTDKQLLGKFLNEITSQKKAIISRRNQATRFLSAVRTRGSVKVELEYKQHPTNDDATTQYAHCVGDDDDFDGSFGSTAVIAESPCLRVGSSSIVVSGVGRDTAENSSSRTLLTLLRLMHEQERASNLIVVD